MMKTTLKTVLRTVLISFALGACTNAPKGDAAKISEEQPTDVVQSGDLFRVDTSASLIRFTGYGVGKNHPGRFKLNYGNISIENKRITGGAFEITIQSLEMDEKGAIFQSKLKPHLLSGDFFDAAKFGTARFEITNVEPYKNGKDSSVVKGANFTISGNLSLKAVTKNISFPANVVVDGNKLKATANFDIDRRQWQMNYGNDKSLGDKFISERVNIELDLKASKQ